MIVPCLLFFAAVWQIVAEDDCTPNNAATAANLMQKKHVRSALLNVSTRDPVGLWKRKNAVEGAGFIGRFEGWAVVVWVQMLVRARWVENCPVCKLKTDMFH